jgi:putative tricarboxylic transport membrane protein
VIGVRTFGLGVAALGGVYLALALQLPMHTLNGPGAGVFPVMVAVALLVTGLLATWRPETATAPDADADAPGSLMAAGIVFAALVAFCLLLQRAGYVLAGVLLVTAVLKVFEARWSTALIISAVSVAATYVVFVELLGLTLPRGNWWP